MGVVHESRPVHNCPGFLFFIVAQDAIFIEGEIIIKQCIPENGSMLFDWESCLIRHKLQ